MKSYFFKLIPPRPDFVQSMTAGEMQLMREHVVYWKELLARGIAVAFGPVADPRGAYGIGIVQLPDEQDPAALSADDPVIKAGVGFRGEISPMLDLVARK
jgi:uncharacterized protein YciI